MDPVDNRTHRSAGVVTLLPMTTWARDRGRPLLGDSFPLPVGAPFTLRDAICAGVTERQVRNLVADGLLRRVLKGVYVATQVPDDIRSRARALRLVIPPSAVVSDWTATWFWTGMLPAGGHLEVAALTVFQMARHARLRNGLCESGSRTFRPSDLTVVDGVRMTAPLRTAWDLGRLAHRDHAIGALDALLRHGTFTQEELVEGVGRFKGMRGVVQLRELAPMADGRSESPGESTLRLRWLDLSSLPPPTPQIPIVVNGIEVYRIDLGVSELRYGCEYDGADFHGPDRDAYDGARRADLDRRFGWTVESVRKVNVYGPLRDVEEVLIAGVRNARRRLGLSPSYER